METYQIKSLSFTYPLQEKPALCRINLTVHAGEFITICGKSGSGKSTLLRHLKTVLTPHGKRQGEIYFLGRPLAESDQREQASSIGFVRQDPDNQIVTDKVWHELAFGLESLGMDNKTIRLRVAEIASFFGIQTWFGKNVAELSGGQKQLLNLASVMAMQPAVLIFDEPAGQLDPIAAADFLGTIRKINCELGTTVILSEHRLEEVLPVADRAVVMDAGTVIVDDTPRQAAEKLKKIKHDIFPAMPAPVQIYAGIDSTLPCPLTVQEGRQWLNALFNNGKKALSKTVAGCAAPAAINAAATIPARQPCPEVTLRPAPPGTRPQRGARPQPIVQLQEVWFKYDRDQPDVVKDLSLEVAAGQFYSIVGGNGTGKTTALSIVSGILRPYRGRVHILGRDIFRAGPRETREALLNKIALLPQNPRLLFVKKTVELDLYEILGGAGLTREEKRQAVRDVCLFAELEELLQMHPYDLSGGEQQRAALAKVLLRKPQILLLDEPTKGLDGHFKIKLAGILKKLTDRGVTVIMVSHDIEFCARYADLCALFFDGGIVTQNTPRAFFCGNNFYTTAANRMARHLFPGAVTVEDVLAACRNNS